MPRINKPGGQGVSPMQLSFAERVRAGRVVPVISDEALINMGVADYATMVKGYADQVVKYTMPDKDNLVKVAKFHQLHKSLSNNALKVDYLNWVKNYIYETAEAEGQDKATLADVDEQFDTLSVSDFANRLAYPNLSGGVDNPLLVLADLPVRIYVTTSPYTFIEDALQAAGKSPCTDFCRWSKLLDGIDSTLEPGYKASASEPLVYHLHGLDTYPDSLVLTEDDHLEFLVNVCQSQGASGDRVLPIVRQAFVDDLILLGFSLSGWAFRDLYAGLIKTSPRQEDRGVCALQLAPTDEEKAYLQDYVRREAKFNVFWGTIADYACEIQGIRQTAVA